MATEQTNPEGPEDNPKAKRGRPAGQPAKAKRQNYAEDLNALRVRVRLALDILEGSNDEAVDAVSKLVLVHVAIKTLKEE